MDASICPTCKLLKDYGNGQPLPDHLTDKEKAKMRQKINKNHDHHHIAQTQHKTCKRAKEEMVAKKRRDYMIMYQDFTQLMPQTGFHQDMIITVLTYDEHAIDKIHRTYYHFVGEQTTKNDVYFVIAVWEHMLKNKIIPDHITTIDVWSDGGPKHFKCKENMYYFSTLPQRYNKTINYNFYQAYHGHNACDAAASHAKKRINEQQRNTEIPIITATSLIESINTLKNHIAQLAPRIAKTTIKVSLVNGIKSYFHYRFPASGTIHAFHHSSARAPAKIYQMKVTSFPTLV